MLTLLPILLACQSSAPGVSPEPAPAPPPAPLDEPATPPPLRSDLMASPEDQLLGWWARSIRLVAIRTDVDPPLALIENRRGEQLTVPQGCWFGDDMALLKLESVTEQEVVVSGREDKGPGTPKRTTRVVLTDVLQDAPIWRQDLLPKGTTVDAIPDPARTVVRTVLEGREADAVDWRCAESGTCHLQLWFRDGSATSAVAAALHNQPGWKANHRHPHVRLLGLEGPACGGKLDIASAASGSWSPER